MIGEWCYYESFFSPQQCDDILKLGLQIEPVESVIGIAGGKLVKHEMRKSVIRWIQSKDKHFEQLFDVMWKMAIESNDKFFNFHISRLNEIQLAEYDASYGGKYDTHHDVFWINNDPKYHRKLSAIIQLTDPSEYEGGEFEFINLINYPNPEIVRKRGTVLFFPSFLEHRAKPVTKGKRHSLACWFEGPKWR